MVRKSKFDNKDIEILRILQKNSRTKYTKIAQILNITEAAIRKRVKKLLKEKIIRKFTIDIDYNLLEYKLCFIGLDIDKDYIFEVIKKIPKNENIKAIYISYGDHNLMIEFLYKNSSELNNFIEKLKNIRGVLKVCPAIIAEKIY
ncbi:MAG: Lrp/AsnC family transcriptional regulator [Candidatus Aenigmatarchaeota archaeon]